MSKLSDERKNQLEEYARSRGYDCAADQYKAAYAWARDMLIKGAAAKLTNAKLSAIKEKAREDRFW